MYLVGATIPDISFAMRKFTSNLGSDHWGALERVIRYLRGILRMDFTILGILLYSKGIVIPTRSHM